MNYQSFISGVFCGLWLGFIFGIMFIIYIKNKWGF
jgi:hypothetical protein